MWLWSWISNFQTHIDDSYIEHFQWNCPQVYATKPHWWKLSLVQVMAWCLRAPSHYLSQCWLRFVSHFGVTRLQTQHKNLCIRYLNVMIWHQWCQVAPPMPRHYLYQCCHSIQPADVKTLPWPMLSIIFNQKLSANHLNLCCIWYSNKRYKPIA